MPYIWTYRLATDAGAAPHISDGVLTLTICKPRIREWANVGDYVLAVVAKGLRTKTQKKNNNTTGFKLRAAYLFKIEKIVEMSKYQEWCSTHATHKLCVAPSYFGDCQYNSKLEYMPGPHGPTEKKRNLGGKNALISRNYAAWTAARGRPLTPGEVKAMGIRYEQAEGQTQGQFKTLLNAGNITAIEALIKEGPHPHASDFSVAAGAPAFAATTAPTAPTAPVAMPAAPVAMPPVSAAAGGGGGGVAVPTVAVPTTNTSKNCVKGTLKCSKKGGKRKTKKNLISKRNRI